jgi:hypothetical protein
MLSMVFTSLGIFSITILSSSCVCFTPCVLISTLNFYFPYGDDTPPSFFVSFSSSISRPYYVESMVGFSSCIPFPLDTSDFFHSASYTSCSGSCVGSCSSSTCNVVCSYSILWISSTSTTMGISLVPPCGTHVLCMVLLSVPTLGGDMVVKSKLQSLNSEDGRKNSHSIALPLGSVLFFLENNKMGRFAPSFQLYSEIWK